MASIKENLEILKSKLPANVTLIAVSKYHTKDEILEAYHQGQRNFGENRVQELLEKEALLPKDIHWHLIGTLQRNKVKYIAHFISLIQSVDSVPLLIEIQKEALKNNRVISVLLQIFIASEETKHGLDKEELDNILENLSTFPNIKFCGLMGMATNTENQEIVRQEFKFLKILFEKVRDTYFKNQNAFKEISMGMSNDYLLAIQEGSTMIRVGSLIFGNRVY